MLPVAIYARVSTEEQSAWSIDRQVEMCAEFVTLNKLAPPEPLRFIDIDSGKNLFRPGIRDLLRRRPEFSHVVIYKWDRLTRSCHDWFHLKEALHGPRHRISCTILCTTQPVDLDRPDGRAMAAMVAVFSELEREMISCRTADALARRRGRNSTYEILKPIILDLKERGLSLRAIALEASALIGKEIAFSTVRFLLKKWS